MLCLLQIVQIYIVAEAFSGIILHQPELYMCIEAGRLIVCYHSNNRQRTHGCERYDQLE
jgi:hypothetical protein